MLRLFRQLRAKINGTFVTDCPHCHKHFYGWHKAAHHVTIKNDKGLQSNYRIVCHRCARLALKGHKNV